MSTDCLLTQTSGSKRYIPHGDEELQMGFTPRSDVTKDTSIAYSPLPLHTKLSHTQHITFLTVSPFNKFSLPPSLFIISSHFSLLSFLLFPTYLSVKSIYPHQQKTGVFLPLVHTHVFPGGLSRQAKKGNGERRSQTGHRNWHRHGVGVCLRCCRCFSRCPYPRWEYGKLSESFVLHVCL